MFVLKNQGVMSLDEGRSVFSPGTGYVDTIDGFVVFLAMALDKNAITKEAQKFAAKGQFDKAIAEWKKLLKETPSDPNIYNTIGDLCLKKDAKSEAVDAYQRAADMLSTDGFTSKAIALYKKILNIDPQKMADLNPSNVAFRTKLADMYAKEGMKKEAVSAYLAAATAHIGGNAFKEARQMFEKVLAQDPNNKEVYHKAGIVYFKEGKFAEACKAFKPAFENDPTDQGLADLYLEALAKAGREQDAVEIYEQILAQDPTRSDLREKLFQLHLEKPEPDKALGEAKKLAEEQIRSLLAAAAEQGHKMLPGAALPGAEQETGAEKALKTFIEKNPGHAGAYRALSEFYDKVGRKEDAARELVKAAGILSSAGDRPGAKEALNRALEVWPGLDEAKRELDRLEAAVAPSAPEAPAAPLGEDPKINEGLTEADVLMKYGLAAKALEQLEALVKQFPDSGRVRLRLRDLYREQGNAGKAVEHSLQAADICSRNGLQFQAETILREALEIDPKNAGVLSRLGMAPPVPEETPLPAEAFGELPAFEEPAAAPSSGQPGPEEEAPAFAPDFGEALTFEEPVLPGAQPEAAPEETPAEPFDALPEEEAPVPEKRRGPATAALLPQEAVEEEKELAAESLEGELDISEVWAEAEFYYQQGLFDEARRKYEKILEQKPDDKRTLKRVREISRQKEEVQEFADLAEAVEGLESLVPEGELASEELAASSSDEEAVRSLMQDIQFMKQQEREREQDEERKRQDQEEQERTEREARDFREREAREIQERALLEARERAEREAREIRERAEQEALEIRERAELEARERTKREARDIRARAEQEALEIRERAEQEARERTERDRELEERELQDKLERAGAAREERERQAAAAPAAEEVPAARLEEDFSDLGDELREAAEDLGGFGGDLGEEAAPAGGGQSEDLFDLEAELRDELSGVAVPERSDAEAEEQSLDDIFEDFKKGIEQQESKQDVNTHYNLGIAYKEMGLLDDAIAEFLMTTEGEQRFVESRYMLGLCYMEQGEYYKAVAEIHNALNYSVSFGGSMEERISMLYDLGLAYQGAGNAGEAIGTFQQVADMDPGYRDVEEKLKELRARPRATAPPRRSPPARLPASCARANPIRAGSGWTS